MDSEFHKYVHLKFSFKRIGQLEGKVNFCVWNNYSVNYSWNFYSCGAIYCWVPDSNSIAIPIKGTANLNTLLYLHNRFTWYNSRIRMQRCIWVEECIRFQTSYILRQVLHMHSCIKIMTSKFIVSCCSLRPEYYNFGDEDGACRSRWRVCGR